MVHLLIEAAKQGNRGPFAATGAVIGLIGAIVAGFTILAPNNCGAEAFGIATGGVTYICGDGPTQSGIHPIQTISWFLIAGASIVGALIGASLGHEEE